MDRLFVAVPLSEPVRVTIATRITDALPEGVPGRAVPAPSWHLTLRFLGDTEPAAAAGLERELRRAALGGPFEITFSSLGAFPREVRAAVLWLGIATGVSELRLLAERVEACARTGGFAPEARPFSPHLTLSRIRPPQNVAPLLGRPTGPEIPMTVDEVVLYRSLLGGGPARHEAAARFPLG
ncbi:MAG: RNA 2',3'-cyclic phosphodiesterase [Gemmatimonadetes bacterium]|nr:RNA 2',3'-cyclic phosphodiesterase [Gemmatimonadota bacterium]